MQPTFVPNTDARRYFLAAQGLSGIRSRPLSDAALLQLVEHLGFVQVDSIKTVERAHHLILFSRSSNYRRAQLARLLEHRAALFENWTHDAAVIPTRFFPLWRRRFARESDVLRERWRKWRRAGFERNTNSILAAIRENGPVMARQFAERDTSAKGAWWDWHPSKTALEFLWRTGELAVTRREGFQKVYDLTERVIPAHFRDDYVTVEQLIDWACRGAFERLGYATPGELASFWGAITSAEARAWCAQRLGKEIIEVQVDQAGGAKPRTAYAFAEFPARAAKIPPVPRRLRVLSPFDPLVRDRSRTERLFNFRYRIEVFVPEAQRQYGYYVFPLLEGDRLVGRIDMKHRRERDTLHVTGLWLEPRIKLTRGRLDRLENELARLCKFVGVASLSFDKGVLGAA